eukprot:TRINITY_DN5922_c0_g1_i7.p2 TRINITY_DN5922_c0_g1~~TRINITY_DN5922_c0_g1_i7.p2  ORF type:complete len:124 (-),score=9.43 TRINITY_DN5922_c0_g1_i7:162-533(-)
MPPPHALSIPRSSVQFVCADPLPRATPPKTSLSSRCFEALGTTRASPPIHCTLLFLFFSFRERAFFRSLAPLIRPIIRSLSHSLTLSLSHSLTLSALSLCMRLCACLFVVCSARCVSLSFCAY